MKLTVSPPLTWSNLLDEHGHRIASDLLEHDAQTIAHRVNCFEEMRDSLQWAVDHFSTLGYTKDDAMMNSVSAALERAKGQL